MPSTRASILKPFPHYPLVRPPPKRLESTLPSLSPGSPPPLKKSEVQTAWQVRNLALTLAWRSGHVLKPAQQPPPLKIIKMGLEDFCGENTTGEFVDGEDEDEDDVYDIFAN